MAKAKAKITLANGTLVVVEGSPSEVANTVNQLAFKSEMISKGEHATERKRAKDKKITTSPTDLILSLADGGFFKSSKDLASIKEGLAEIGHIYPVQTLSSIVFKMVRRRYLRRVKQGGRWVYLI
ncbi:MAG: hypothetical protein Q8N65_00730 [bacterium]|nr:hypothetical protein [bacterium]